MATLLIKDLVITAKHGVHKYEKLHPQRFNVSVALTVDTSKAGKSDDLNDTVNWSELRQLVVDTVEKNSFNLMERLAQEVAAQIKADKRASKVTVKIEKLDAWDSGVPGIELTLE